ncbi:MAG: RNA-binding S4 domain-containing protein [Bacteroidetes bacterium]|nr:RNA-binding S4 domain-containing protein [Bacteroidota bacterium]
MPSANQSPKAQVSTDDKKKCRVDQWLWAVRIYKTRSLASEACRTSRVKQDDIAVKPSRLVAGGEILTVRKGMVTHRYRVIQPLEKRVGPPLVPEYMEDLTPQGELDKLLPLKSIPVALRERGTGRPTKKDRRDMDDWRNDG